MATVALTTVASKQAALKERLATEKALTAEIDKLVKLHVDGEVEIPAGCFSRLVRCPSLPFLARKKGIAVSTVESLGAAAATSVTAAAADAALGISATASESGTARATQRGDLSSRLFGKSKKKEAESKDVKIEVAMQEVQARVEGLQDRLSLARQRALAHKRAGKHEAALREMKKAKGVEKQLAVANAAMDALERQEAVLAQSNLQRELAAALSSTNTEVKRKTKGLLDFAEKAVDESIEVADDAQDIGAVFEGLVGAGGDGDDDELLEELNAMMADEDDVAPPPARHAIGATSVSAVAAAVGAVPMPEAVPASCFPSVPKEKSRKAAAAIERTGLLAAGV